MDVSRGHVFLAGGVATAAVVAGGLAMTADASQAGNASSAMPCNPGYHVEEIQAVPLNDGRIGAAQVCARSTGKATPTSSPPPVTSTSAAPAPLVTAHTVTVTVTGTKAAAPRARITVSPPRVTVRVPARTVRVTVTPTR
jgi:hypothetical protein